MTYPLPTIQIPAYATEAQRPHALIKGRSALIINPRVVSREDWGGSPSHACPQLRISDYNMSV